MNKSTGYEPTYTWSQMQKQIDLAVKKEREACAKIVDDWFHSLASEPEMEKIAEQIRARGENK